MAHFGQFMTGKLNAIHNFEGDYMLQDQEFVKIFRKSNDPNIADTQVAAIRLDNGQSVKELSSNFQTRV
jgi:hypothetical protein